MVRTGAWALSNICRVWRGEAADPDEAVLAPALPILARLLHCEDEEVQRDALWSLAYLSEGSNDRIGRVLDAGVSQQLVGALEHASIEVCKPALRAVGNIVTGDDTQTAALLDTGCLERLRGLMGSADRALRKEVCWLLSNVTAGPEEHIQAVIDAGLVPLLNQLLRDPEPCVQKEAAWAVANATQGSQAQVQCFVEASCLDSLCNLLAGRRDAAVLCVVLEALERIVKASEQDTCLLQIASAGGLDRIEQLQQHQTASVRDKSRVLLRCFQETRVIGSPVAALPRFD